MLNSTTLAATTVTTTETTVAAITTNEFVFCTAASLVLGLIIAFAFNFKQKKTKSFMMTLALLPVIVQVVIMLVNGNIGTGVAVRCIQLGKIPFCTGKCNGHLCYLPFNGCRSCDGHEPPCVGSYAGGERELAEHCLHAFAYWQEVGSQGSEYHYP